MSDATDTTPDASAPTAPEPMAEKHVSMPSDAFAKRLAQESEKGAKALLKELGISSKDELALLIKSKKDADDKELSESQRLKKTLEEVTPKAERAAKLEQQLKGMVEDRLKALSPEQRALIEEEAGDNIEEQLRLIKFLGKATPAAPASAPKPAAPATNAAPPAPTPTSTQKTAFERWNEKPEGQQKTLFYSMNRAEIERTRPQ